MTHAELLRSHANLAIKEGGMYYSGEYLSRIATVAESLESENAKLRELVSHYNSALSRMCDQTQGHVDCQGCVLGKDYDEDACAIDELRDTARELEAEVD